MRGIQTPSLPKPEFGGFSAAALWTQRTLPIRLGSQNVVRERGVDARSDTRESRQRSVAGRVDNLVIPPVAAGESDDAWTPAGGTFVCRLVLLRKPTGILAVNPLGVYSVSARHE